MIKNLERCDSGFRGSENENCLWIKCVDPSQEEIDLLKTKYGIPTDYIYDALDPYESARGENILQMKDGTAALIMLLYPVEVKYHDYPTFETRPISMICKDNTVITVTKDDADFFETPLKDREFRIQEAESAESLVLELAWKISQRYIETVKILAQQRITLENSLRNDTDADSLYQVMSIQKGNLNLEDGIDQNRPVIDELRRSPKMYTSEHTEELIHDLIVENRQGQYMVSKSSRMVQQLSQTYQNVISTNLNVVMKVQTSISIILVLPTIVAGYWGMNVLLPIAGAKYAFLAMLGISGVLCGIAYAIFKKMDYL